MGDGWGRSSLKNRKNQARRMIPQLADLAASTIHCPLHPFMRILTSIFFVHPTVNQCKKVRNKSQDFAGAIPFG